MTSYEAFVTQLSNGNKQLTATRMLNDAALSDLVHAVIGLSGEAGEVLDLVKKTIYYDRPLYGEMLLEELGDVMHYLTAAAVSQGWTLQDLQNVNRKKLLQRYPDGKFSAENANNRLDKVSK